MKKEEKDMIRSLATVSVAAAFGAFAGYSGTFVPFDRPENVVFLLIALTVLCGVFLVNMLIFRFAPMPATPEVDG